MEVFIVRPFGIKPLVRRDKYTGKITEETDFDFDKVEKDLIMPALGKLNIPGGTTGKIFESGDIREDMFSLLLSSEIVIADITIHNANVFYELGIRHALRDKKTILLKCPGYDDTPFDILGYRYVSYGKDDPSAAVPVLMAALQETLLSDRKDSPVFNMLPKLDSQDPRKLVVIPRDFIEEAEIAARSRQQGLLSLLATEVQGFNWELPALRILGEMFFKIKAWEEGCAVWEKISMNYTDDIEANDRLATIYQRLAEKEMGSNPEEGERLLAHSDVAIESLLRTIPLHDRNRKAEALSLWGRNEKSRWLQSWRNLPQLKWSTGALRSESLFNAYEKYKRAFYEDLNHFYSGINALGMLTVIISLAKTNPDVWELHYLNKKEADQKLAEFQEDHHNLANSIQISLDAHKARLEETGETDQWLKITEADFYCLTGTDPARAAIKYTKALEGTDPLTRDATIRQLKIYDQLDIVAENVRAALSALPETQPDRIKTQLHYLLFTGHMIDKPDRKPVRFPAVEETIVRQKLKEIIETVRSKEGNNLLGIAGGACGGDILFHEICREAGIPTELYLALPREPFLVESVEFAGVEWVERFDALYKHLPHHILSQTKELPKWLRKKESYRIWERNNLWELSASLAEGGINMTLVALWDGKGGDGPGGTADMVKQAKARGAKTIVIRPGS
jgi:hypothetical protein